jgi:hypothetical protein
LILALVALTRDRDDAPLSDVPPAGGIALLEPLGDVAAVSQFRWESKLFLDRFYVEVRDQDGVIYFATVRTTSFVVPADLQEKLVAGRYRWRVLGRDTGRAALIAPPPASFAITP